MQIDKINVGQSFFFEEATVESIIVYYGKLISILPKYMFMDRFSSSYAREQTYLFEVTQFDGVIKKAVSSENYIYKEMSDINSRGARLLFDPSVIIKIKEDAQK